MITGQVYGKIVNGRNLTALKKEASTVANMYMNALDELFVTYNNGRTARYIRMNTISPNGSVKRGEWK
jgi:hypothetical protein